MVIDGNDGIATWHIRPGTRDDFSFLARMLYEAHYWQPARRRQPLDVVLADSHLARYIKDWGRPGDIAMIAEVSSHPVGAAWCRIFEPHEAGYGYIGASIPELSIGVAADYRGHGVGTDLLAALLNASRDSGFTAVCLSVEFTNPAVALYERHGFNKVGTKGGAWTMRRDLRSLPSEETHIVLESRVDGSMEEA